MTKVIFDISMSLDGFVTASNVSPEEPLAAVALTIFRFCGGGRMVRSSGRRCRSHTSQTLEGRNEEWLTTR
jgi:hypothetical protein